jgi:hypothetical protein
MTHSLLESWKTWAVADAERRGLSGLKPILEGLAVSTARLRATAWQPGPDPQPPNSPHSPEGAHGR